MPRTASQFKEMKDQRVASIFEAALPLFIEFGTDKITVDKICIKAKCSHGLVYHYFKDTDDIYNALIKLEQFKNIKASLIGDTKNKLAIDVLKNFVEVLLKASEDKDLSMFAHLVLNEEGKNAFKDVLIKTLKQGQKEGEVLGGDPNDLANLFIYFFKGLYYKNMTTKKEIEIPSVDVVMYLFKKNRY